MNFSVLNHDYLGYKKQWLANLCMLVILSLPLLAIAHTNEYLSTIKGAHGGMLRMSEMYHFELAIKDGEARVWVTDHGDKPQSTKEAVGTLRVISGNDAFLVRLAPTGRNELLIKDARITARKETRLLLSVRMKGEQFLSTRFSM